MYIGNYNCSIQGEQKLVRKGKVAMISYMASFKHIYMIIVMEMSHIVLIKITTQSHGKLGRLCLCGGNGRKEELSTRIP